MITVVFRGWGKYSPTPLQKCEIRDHPTGIGLNTWKTCESVKTFNKKSIKDISETTEDENQHRNKIKLLEQD